MTELADDVHASQQIRDAFQAVKSQLSKVIVGQEEVIEEVLIALFAGGHCLLVGVPGLAKTLLVRSLAKSFDLDFRRIQFTPDLMPSDITGTEVLQQDKTTGDRHFRFLEGPIFGNMILADEINRTPPKTQAALLEAMQEMQVTVSGQKRELPQPFFVLATQNPIEQEGTYPLPEAQLDRFMFTVHIDYPNEDDELEIVLRTTSDNEPQTTTCLTAREILTLRELVRRVPIAEHVARYAIRLARLTRPTIEAPKIVRDFVVLGAGPRASQFLVLGAKARAILHGRVCVETDDIQAIAAPVLRHRIRLNFNAEAEGVTVEDLISQLVDLVPTVEDESNGGILSKVFRSPNAG